jgi:MFS family permease
LFALCIFIWSLATMWSGWAGHFEGLSGQAQLFTARFLIGIGEAGCLVIGPTLIADYFSTSFRGRALSLFFLGMPLGGMAGYAVAALSVKHLGEHGWQSAFYFAGLPGLPLAVIVWFLLDPPRGGSEAVQGHGHGGKFEGFAPYLELLKNRTLRFIILAQAFAVVILVPLLHFGVKFLQAKFEMAKDEATLRIGVIALLAGVLGNSLSGVLGDRLASRMRGAYALMAGIAYSVGAPFLIIGFATTMEWVMLASLTFGAFCFFLCMPAVNTQIANVVSAHHRARAYALAVFILHLLGDTLAPILFGFASNAIGRETAFIVFSCALFASGACALMAARTAQLDELAVAERT